MKTLCQPNANGICKQCNKPLPKDLRRTCVAHLRLNPPEPIKPVRRWLLFGDIAERFLAAFGITQKNYVRFKRFIGFKANCKCNKRIQRWNVFGARIDSMLNRLFKK